MNNLDLNKLQKMIDERVDEVIDKVEWQLEDTEEYDRLTDELWKLEQSSAAFYRLTLCESVDLSEEDVYNCKRYLVISEKIERIGWKLMYIQGIKDSFEIIEKILNS